MKERLNLDEILSRNPGIDRAELEEAREVLQRARDQGMERKGYDLALPFGGRRVAVQDDDQAEPPLIRSRRLYEP
jgi:hypothetical protein